ncbi:MAG: HIRAN domain-containing protein [Candidatus Limnocylindrales bacterium]
MVNAILVAEEDNPHDPNAVAVWVQGHQVGHLSREDAVQMRPGLLALQERAGTWIALHGAIAGGGPRDTLGVFLRYDPGAFGLPVRAAAAAHHDTGGHVRTGLAEALSMDAEDDRYGLAWVSQVPDDPSEAAEMLASRLASEPEPVSRHFLYAQFEGHLYRLRDSHPDALRLFDEACTSHDAEMDAIRPALIAMFNRLPLLEVYRQAAIRHQKAHDWEQAVHWARRGLAVYGEDALDPDNVSDLNERIAKYEAKLEAERAPKPIRERRPNVERAPSPPSHPVTGETEVLTCQSCGRTFERVRTRGRKPTRCPDCREAPVEASTNVRAREAGRSRPRA